MGKFKAKIKGFFSKIVKGVKFFTAHWKVAPEGRYLSFKEFTAYSVGGMGVVGATVLPAFITLAYGANIAAALGFSNNEIYWVGIATGVITLLRSPFTSMIIDNTNTKFGKFRPYLIWMPLPILVMFFAIGWLPVMFTNRITSVVVFAVLFNILNFFTNLYTVAFNSLVQVISPSPKERTDLMSYGAFVYSLGPSITNALFPLMANMFFTYSFISNGETVKIFGQNTIGPYKWILPLFMAAFMALGLWTAFGTKERVIVPKTFKQRVKFVNGVKNTLENKYFWLSNVSGILGVFKLFGNGLTYWICYYILAPKVSDAVLADSVYSIVITLFGTASVPGLLLAPLIINKFGKRKVIIFSNIIVVLLNIPMLIFINQPYMLLVSIYFINLFNAVQVVTGPAITSQIYDYQQYKTGDRLEGFLSQFGTILVTGFGFITALVQPAVMKKFGYLSEVAGQASPLLNDAIRNPIMIWMCVIGIVSGILATIPMLFWDLTETRHEQIMDILKVRANCTDGLCDAETAAVLEAQIDAGEKNVLDFFKTPNVEKSTNEAAVS